MQTALNAYLVIYQEKRSQQDRGTKGRTPMQVFLDGRTKSTSSTRETPKRQLDPQRTAAWAQPRERHCQVNTVAVQTSFAHAGCLSSFVAVPLLTSNVAMITSP